MRPLVYYFLTLIILIFLPVTCILGYTCVVYGVAVALDSFLFIDKYLLFILVIVFSSFIHETGHYLAAQKATSVDGCKWEITWLRVSLICTGNITPKERILIALAGPGPCLILGLFLCLSPSARIYGLVFCAHLIFLLPTFGDGRQLLAGVLHLITKSKPTPKP